MFKWLGYKVRLTPGERLILKSQSLLFAQLKKLEKSMSQITDYVAAVEAQLADISGDLSTISTNASTTAATLQAQVDSLTAQLAAAGGTLSPEDKAALDQSLADLNALAATADAAAGKTAAPTAPSA